MGAPPASATCRRPSGHKSPGRVEDRLRDGDPANEICAAWASRSSCLRCGRSMTRMGTAGTRPQLAGVRFGPSSDAARKDASARQEVAASRPTIDRHAHTAGQRSVGPTTIVTKMVCAPLGRVGGQLAAHRPPRAQIRAGGSTRTSRLLGRRRAAPTARAGTVDPQL